VTAEQLLHDMTARGIALSADVDRLRWKAPPGRVTPATLSLLRAHKPELIRILAPAKPPREMQDRRAFYAMPGIAGSRR
jgi:hypothetical protein